MAGEPIWPGPTMLVPITVEAMVFTNRPQNQRWSWERPHYESLKYFEPVGEIPFSSEKPSFPGHTPGTFTGAVLHWALPSGITGGAEAAPGAIRYPKIPARWLIVRKAVKRDDPTTFAYRAGAASGTIARPAETATRSTRT